MTQEYKYALARRLFRILIALLGMMLVTGCGEETEEIPRTVADVTMYETLGDMKRIETVPMAPPAPGVPFVKEIRYFHNWKLTKEIEKSVSVGDTIFVKVVFSEPMKHIVADDKSARPILYYRQNEKDKKPVRFRMAAHGAGGEDFVSGDAKPLQSGTDDYICKYTVVPEDAGKQIAFMVGRFSVDLENNPLSRFYTHKKKLQVKGAVPQEPSEPILFMHGGDGTSNKPAEYRGVAPNERDFSGYVLIPKERVGTGKGTVRGLSQPVEGVTVTLIAGPRAGRSTVTDQNGQYIFRNEQGDGLRLRVQREHFETKEVVVYRSRPTALADGTVPNHKDDPQEIPGNILIGQAWPESIRPLLQRVPLVSDPLYIVAKLRKRPGGGHFSGFYGDGVITISLTVYPPNNPAYVLTAILAHEIAHMRQEALVDPNGGAHPNDWVDTPEGRAFAEARQKDWDEVGKAKIDHAAVASLTESAAEFCAYYWTHGNGVDWEFYGDLKVTAPNRYQWAQEWLGEKYIW